MSYKTRIEEYTNIIRKIPCLCAVADKEDMDLIANVLEEFAVYEGEDVCIAGDDAGLLFIIYKGTCEVLKDGVVQRTIAAGDWFGEEQLMDGIVAEVTVRATTEVVTVLGLDKSNLSTVIKAAVECKSPESPMSKRFSVLQSKLSPETAASLLPASGGNNSNMSRRSHLLGLNPFLDHRDKTQIADGIARRRLSKRIEREMMKRQPEIDIRSTKPVGVLGEGSFGTVLLIEDKTSGKSYALKALSKEQMIKERVGASVQNERSIMSMLSSPFVAQLYLTYQDRKHIYFLMEPALGGELFDLYTQCDLFRDLPAAKFYIGCVTVALQYVHKKKIVYRDLKLENCLVDKLGYLKISDFGISKIVVGKTYTVCGTADYFAPETLKQTGHNRAVDWWACGVLLFIMSTGRSPFDAPEVTMIYKHIIKGFSKVQFPVNVPADLIDVVKSLCRKKPEERITMQKGNIANLQEMPFFSGFVWEQLEGCTMEPPFMPPPPDLKAIARRQASIVVSPQDLLPWDGSLPHADITTNVVNPVAV